MRWENPDRAKDMETGGTATKLAICAIFDFWANAWTNGYHALMILYSP
jgi:hypothetical protein